MRTLRGANSVVSSLRSSHVQAAIRSRLRVAVKAADYEEAVVFYRDVPGLPERAASASPDGPVTSHGAHFLGLVERPIWKDRLAFSARSSPSAKGDVRIPLPPVVSAPPFVSLPPGAAASSGA